MSPSQLETYCPSCGRKYPPGDESTKCIEDGSELLPATDDPLVGQTIANKFRIIDVLGTGGYSTVYRAVHLALERPVAFKLLRSDLVASKERIARFEQEAKLASSLKHRNICAVYDCGMLETGQPYLVMEHLEGRSLARALEQSHRQNQDGPMPGALSLIKQIAAGLRSAHDKGIVHRDLKPANIMLVKDENEETAKIIDFGIAKLFGSTESEQLTASGASLGTPSYMSPEQIRGEKVDARSDIYTFGCVMYEILTGRRAFEGRTTFETMQRHLGSDPPPMVIGDRAISFPLREVTLKCVSKDPADRFQSVAEIQKSLEELGDQEILSTLVLERHSLDKRAHWAWIPLVAASAVFLFWLWFKPGSGARYTTPAMPVTAPYDPAIVKMMGEFKLLQQSGRQDAAERVGKRTYALLLNSGRQYSPEMIMVSKELQDFYVRNYRRTEASQYVRQAFEARKRLHGSEPEVMLNAHRDAAKGFVDAAQPQLALEHLKSLLDLTGKRSGKDSEQYCDVLHELARAEAKSGADKDAHLHYGQLLALMEKIPPGSARKLLPMMDLCAFYADRNRPDKAKRIADELISSLPADTSQELKVDAYRAAAHAAERRGDMNSAVQMVGKSIDTARAVSRDEWILAELLTLRGTYFRQLKDYKQAERDFREGLKLLESTHGLHSNDYQFCLNEYIKLLKATSRNKEAETIRMAGSL
jgi:serine/threonine protein kinase